MTEDKNPRRQVVRIRIDVMIPRSEKQEDGVDLLESENFIGITTDTKPSKLMAQIKPQLVDALAKARAHVPSVLVQVNKPKLILPGE